MILKEVVKVILDRVEAVFEVVHVEENSLVDRSRISGSTLRRWTLHFPAESSNRRSELRRLRRRYAANSFLADRSVLGRFGPPLPPGGPQKKRGNTLLIEVGVLRKFHQESTGHLSHADSICN